MERLWSPAVATGGNRLQMGRAGESLKQAKTVAWVAIGCRGNAMVRNAMKKGLLQ
jgi:hypothetical protein